MPNLLPRQTRAFQNIAAVTPNDTTDLAVFAQSLYIEGAGNIVVITSGGQEVTLAVPANFTLRNVEISRVKATGTTATGIFAIY